MVSKEQIYEYILTYQMAWPGKSPSYSQIMEELNILSKATVHARLQDLMQDGRVESVDRNGITLSDTILVKRDELNGTGDQFVRRVVNLRRKIG